MDSSLVMGEVVEGLSNRLQQEIKEGSIMNSITKWALQRVQLEDLEIRIIEKHLFLI